MTKKINVIGAGLAGSEACYQLAKRKIPVNLYEMKPNKKSEAHHIDGFAELVCSNSLKSDLISTSSGLLKKELQLLDSLILKTAYETRVPAGGALAVDREIFSEKITKYLKESKYINIINEEVEQINVDDINIVATGPLSSDKLITNLLQYTGSENLFFFDAAAPVITFDSIDMTKAYYKSRYDKGESDYINCSMSKEQYDKFYHFLINGETVQLKEFENKRVFENCMPVEVMAKRGYETLRFGPLKPVGLDSNAYAVVQLRQDNMSGTLFNLVGFQTNLKFKEQVKLLQLIPGLEHSKIQRYGVMHKNIYINSPKLLNKYSQFKNEHNIFIAGQLSGVEGYMESTMSGLITAINVSKMIKNESLVVYPLETMSGALLEYISNKYNSNFQPMNSNFGILTSLNEKIKNKNERKMAYSKRGIEIMKETIKAYSI